MADYALVSAATVAAPKTYTLPGTISQVALHAVTASFDGTGAAGTFTPALQMIAPDGTVMWTAVPAISLAAGASADVSWFPRIAGASVPAAGNIIQTYHALPAAADFPFNSSVLTNSNWPANSTFNKISDTSLLFFSLNCDVDPGATPDTIELLILVDGNDISNVALPIVNANIMTFSWPRVFVTGIGFPSGIPAGPHTFNLGVETFNNRSCNLRSSTSCDMQVIEFEAGSLT